MTETIPSDIAQVLDFYLSAPEEPEGFEHLPAFASRHLTPEQYRVAVMSLQEEIAKLPQVECPVTHTFAPGVYVRECRIPQGAIAIGKLHRYETVNMLIKGEITVATEDGPKRLTAPYTFVSAPYTKKAAYAHTDVVWANVIPTDKNDPDEIEKDVICESYDSPEFIAYTNQTLQIKE